MCAALIVALEQREQRRVAFLERTEKRPRAVAYMWMNGGDMKKPIVVGVVGCGYWGPNLVRNCKGFPNCNLKAMCDMSEEHLKHLRTFYSDVTSVCPSGC